MIRRPLSVEGAGISRVKQKLAKASPMARMGLAETARRYGRPAQLVEALETVDRALASIDKTVISRTPSPQLELPAGGGTIVFPNLHVIAHMAGFDLGRSLARGHHVENPEAGLWTLSQEIPDLNDDFGYTMPLDPRYAPVATVRVTEDPHFVFDHSAEERLRSGSFEIEPGDETRFIARGTAVGPTLVLNVELAFNYPAATASLKLSPEFGGKGFEQEFGLPGKPADEDFQAAEVRPLLIVDWKNTDWKKLTAESERAAAYAAPQKPEQIS